MALLKQNNKYISALKIVFWALAGVFVFIGAQFFVPIVRDLFKGSTILFLLPFIIFCLLGLALIFLTIKGKIEGTLKKLLLLTGISASGFFVSIFLHNAFYALFGVEEPFFFIIAIFICPLGFLIGLIASIVLFIRK